MKKRIFVFAIVTALVLLSWIFVDVNVESIIRDEAGSCICVVFDKPLVKGADRIVIYENGQVITITDKDTVRQIAGLFTVANRTGLCEHTGDLRLEIYNGDRLVRKITENCDDGFYHIYDRDLLHWVFPSADKNGQLELSDEDQLWLMQIIDQNK
jgi:hypothetical protein